MSAGLPLRRAGRAELLAPVAVALPALARLPLRDPAGGQAHTALAQELVACAAAAFVALVAWRAGAPLARDRVTKLCAALVGLEVLAGVFAPNPWAALRATALVVAGAATFLGARALAARDDAHVARLAPLGMIAIVAASVVLEAFGVIAGWSRTGHAPGGLLGERNAAAELLVVALPWAVWRAVHADARRSERYVATAALGLSAAAIVLTRTRSAWLALGALGVVGVALALRTKDDAARARAGAAVVVLALATAAAAALPPRIAWASAHPYRETLAHLVDARSASGAGRLVQYTTTLRMAASHPVLGVGPGNWSGQYLAYAGEGDPTVRLGYAATNRLPSTDVLGFLAERGAPALLVALALAVAIARGRDDARWMRRATLLAVLVVGSLDAVLQLGPHLVLVAWILGTTTPRGEERPAPRVLFPALAAASLFGVLLAGARVEAFVLVTRARSLEDLERATWLDRGNVPLRLAVAETLTEAGRCADARRHVALAHALAVPSAASVALAQRCASHFASM